MKCCECGGGAAVARPHARHAEFLVMIVNRLVRQILAQFKRSAAPRFASDLREFSPSFPKMAPQLAWGKPVKTFKQRCTEIERCNDLRARITAYCKLESLTQPQFAEKIHVSTQQVSKFMSGTCLSGSEVYARSNVYLKTKMPLRKCYEERAKIVNTKWVMTQSFLTFPLGFGF